MQTSLWGIARKAKQDKKYRFGNLYGLIDKNALYIAFGKLNSSAAAGIDKETAKQFRENLDENLEEIVSELKQKKYKAKLVKRVYIPKGENEKRPLGLPVLRDKIVQRAVTDILEAIFEQDFVNESYGYRPGRNAHQAVKAIEKEISGKYSYVVEADIKGFFNNIDHYWMLRMLKGRIKDNAFLGLIMKWLKAGIMEPNGEIINPVNGCPQGSVISPILANIYLHHVIDKWFTNAIKVHCTGEAYLCRLADDFICAFRYKGDAENFYNVLGMRLEKFGLEVAKEKTGIIRFTRFQKNPGTRFTFLGFEFQWKSSRNGKDYIAKRTSPKKMTKSLKAFTDWCKENRNNRIRKIVDMVNSKLRGYFNYYGLRGNSKSINTFYKIATEILYKWLNRRSQRKSFNFDEFNEKMKYYRLIKPKITESTYTQISMEDLGFV